jgi:fatty-acid peroxygenase
MPGLPDDSFALAKGGYDFLAQRRHESPDPRVADIRIMGKRVVAVGGPELTREFYDADRFTRENALPGFVLDTLFGRGAVHTLEGAAHRERKAMMVDVLHGDHPEQLIELIAAEWDAAALRWQDSGARLSLHRASAEVLLVASCAWMGVPLSPGETSEKTDWMLAMVDGFLPTGWRHVRARRARRCAEEWIARMVVRSRESGGRFSSRWRAIVEHKDATGALLDPHVVAVEVLNILRPATAISWFVAYAGHALARWPEHRAELSDSAYATAFAHELRRFYPFVPGLGALSRRDQQLGQTGVDAPAGTLVVLDVYGQHHDRLWWDTPEAFRPARFRDRPIDAYTLIPQGGGDMRTGHRCPGEDATVGALACIVPRLASMAYSVPDQDLRIPLRRIPAHVNSGLVIEPGGSGTV